MRNVNSFCRNINLIVKYSTCTYINVFLVPYPAASTFSLVVLVYSLKAFAAASSALPL